MGIVFAFFTVLFFAPELVVNWTAQDTAAVSIIVPGHEGIVKQCLKDGFEMRYRYEMQLCHRNIAWFDSCKKRRVERRSVQFDPISESYAVEQDRLGDLYGPESSTSQSISDALLRLSALEQVPLTLLSGSYRSGPANSELYLSVRVIAHCRGEYSKIIKGISSLITLGLVTLGGFDTGWLDFKLFEPAGLER